MFETLSGRRRSRPALTLSLGAHALFAALLTVPPLLATQEPPEADEKVPPFVVTVDLRDKSEEKPILLIKERKVTTESHRASSKAPAPANVEPLERTDKSVPPPAQPSAVPSKMPAAPDDSAYSPLEESERSELVPGSGTDPSGGDGPRGTDGGGDPNGCKDCPIWADAPNVISPVAIFTPEPFYPQAARIGRSQGTVLLRAVIGEDGLVRKVEVRESPNPLLSRAASDAVLLWRYQPGRIGSRPVPVYLYVTVRFTLRF